MRKIVPIILASLSAGALFAVPAHAAQTAYVAATSAVSPGAGCPATAPCLTIADALTAANAGGEVIILDSATYTESNSITKTVVLTAANRPVIVAPAGSSAFNLATANVTLSLSGVIVDGQGASGTASGINVTNGRNLFISDCSIRNFGGAGVVAGIYVKPPSGVNINVFVTGSSVSGNTFGLVLDGTAGGTMRASMTGSLVSVNTNNGLTASTSGSGNAVFLLHHVRVQGNGFGVVGAGSGAGFLVDDSRIFGNNVGIQASGGAAVLSYGNNNLNANTTDGAFTGNIGLH
jgi:hypothetical protein